LGETFINPDGSKTASVAQSPVMYKNVDSGEFETIDPTLTPGLAG